MYQDIKTSTALRYKGMEPPEDSLLPGLTWAKFSSAYSHIRSGASTQERSAAWNRYKQKSNSPKKSPKSRKSSPKSRKRSPVRTITNPANLANLPADVLRNIGMNRGAAAVLAQLGRRTNEIARPLVLTHCADDITKGEIKKLLIEYVNFLISYKPKKKGEKHQTKTVEYIVFSHGRVMHRTYYLRLTSPGRVTIQTHGYTLRVVENTIVHRQGILSSLRGASVLESIQPTLDEDIEKDSILLPSPQTIDEILQRRDGCAYTVRIRSNFIREHIMKILRSTGSLYMENMLSQPAWNVDVMTTNLSRNEGTPGLGVEKVLVVMGLRMWEISPTRLEWLAQEMVYTKGYVTPIEYTRKQWQDTVRASLLDIRDRLGIKRPMDL